MQFVPSAFVHVDTIVGGESFELQYSGHRSNAVTSIISSNKNKIKNKRESDRSEQVEYGRVRISTYLLITDG